MKIFLLLFTCFITIASCKKQQIKAEQNESSAQTLSKITRTADYGGGTFSISYEFNSDGNITAEGNKRYYRDDKQRIVRILDPGTLSNREDIQVYYSDDRSGKVSYTFCTMTGGEATDSVVYLHDENGRLVKTMSYVHYFENYYTPDTTFLAQYDIFKYDTEGNLVQSDDFKINNGFESHCGQSVFENYNTDVNPLYSNDEVRIPQTSCGDMLNNSMNNFTKKGSYTKMYEYRTDGRPRSCLVQLNGSDDFKLVFEYK